jgi:phosphotriesterase-related protein
MPHLITTLGPKSEDELGLILPHEHVFVDLRTWDQPGYAEADPEDVIAQIGPEIARAQGAGVTALVEPSTVGVGRRADILLAVSEATGLPIVVPTGIYREPWIPDWAHTASEDELYGWMLAELTEQIEDTGVQAGWIKLSAGDDGMTETEAKILRAAARASMETNAAIGSHTIRGRVVNDQLDILEQVGCDPRRFVWIHASADPERTLNIDVAHRGAWIEYDWIGGEQPDEEFVARIQMMFDAGLVDHVLLSQDRGWYDPAQPGGGVPKPYTYITDEFMPKLAASGFAEVTLRRLMAENPFRAFAR